MNMIHVAAIMMVAPLNAPITPPITPPITAVKQKPGNQSRMNSLLTLFKITHELHTNNPMHSFAYVNLCHIFNVLE